MTFKYSLVIRYPIKDVSAETNSGRFFYEEYEWIQDGSSMIGNPIKVGPGDIRSVQITSNQKGDEPGYNILEHTVELQIGMPSRGFMRVLLEE